jgi:hypothetical protein
MIRSKLFLAFIALLLLGACASTEGLPVMCRHRALLSSAVMAEKYPVRIVVGKTEMGMHAQAQALIGHEWRWLQTDGNQVFVGKQEYQMKDIQVRSFLDISLAWSMNYEKGKAASPILKNVDNLAVMQGDQIRFTVKGTEMDWPGLKYSASNLPRGAAFDPADGAFSWKPGADQVGVYRDVRFTAIDESLPISPASKSITISVLSVH